MITDKTFGEWLSEELEERGWGIRTLARKIDPENPEVPRRAINRYIHNRTTPSAANVQAIATALGLNPADMPVRREARPKKAVPFRGRTRRDAGQSGVSGGSAGAYRRGVGT